MTMEAVYERFLAEFPHMKVLKYYDNSRHKPNSIKIWLKNHNRLIFSIEANGFRLERA